MSNRHVELAWRARAWVLLESTSARCRERSKRGLEHVQSCLFTSFSPFLPEMEVG